MSSLTEWHEILMKIFWSEIVQSTWKSFELMNITKKLPRSHPADSYNPFLSIVHQMLGSKCYEDGNANFLELYSIHRCKSLHALHLDVTIKSLLLFFAKCRTNVKKPIRNLNWVNAFLVKVMLIYECISKPTERYFNMRNSERITERAGGGVG